VDQSAEERAAFYEKEADDESAARELRMLFARKANWLRILARLEAKKEESGQSARGSEAPDRERLLFSPTRMATPRRRALCCAELAETASSGAARQTFLQLAKTWTRLASELESNRPPKFGRLEQAGVEFSIGRRPWVKRSG
jgi:hypothetical protein